MCLTQLRPCKKKHIWHNKILKLAKWTEAGISIETNFFLWFFSVYLWLSWFWRTDYWIYGTERTFNIELGSLVNLVLIVIRILEILRSILLPVLMATNLEQILCRSCTVSIVPAFTQCDLNANQTKQGKHWSLSFISSRLLKRSQEPEVSSLKTDRPSIRSSWDW